MKGNFHHWQRPERVGGGARVSRDDVYSPRGKRRRGVSTQFSAKTPFQERYVLRLKQIIDTAIELNRFAVGRNELPLGLPGFGFLPSHSAGYLFAPCT